MATQEAIQAGIDSAFEKTARRHTRSVKSPVLFGRKVPVRSSHPGRHIDLPGKLMPVNVKGPTKRPFGEPYDNYRGKHLPAAGSIKQVKIPLKGNNNIAAPSGVYHMTKSASFDAGVLDAIASYEDLVESDEE